MYLMEFKGDLPTKAPILCQHARTFSTLENALKWLEEHLAIEHDDDIHPGTDKFWVDPEDDRILIWEVSSDSELSTLRWHFSGWHWTPDANEHPGGPLEQGSLLGDTMPLYDRAMSDY